MSLRDWTKQSGAFKIGEFTKAKGNLVAGTSVENFTMVGDGTNKFAIAAGIKQTGKRYRYTFEVVQGVSTAVQVAHTIENGTFTTIDDFGRVINSTGVKQVTFTTKTLDATGQRVQISWLNSVAGETYEVKNFVVEELDPLPTITTGTKYLECTTAGNITIPTTQAFGTWEFDINKINTGSIIIELSGNIINKFADSVGTRYWFIFFTDGYFYIVKKVGSSQSILFKSSTTYAFNAWYSIRITRSIYGVFTLWVKGGTLGDTWTQLTANIGTNPTAADLTLTTNVGLNIDMTAGAQITNIRYYDGVRQ